MAREAVGRDAGPPGRAYRVRLAGGRHAVPVRLTKAEPDFRGEIRRLVGGGDFDGLGRLLRAEPAAGEQYHELTMNGELAASATVAKGPARVPADVPEAEVQAQARRIGTLLATKDYKTLEALRRSGNAAFQAGWTALAQAGADSGIDRGGPRPPR